MNASSDILQQAHRKITDTFPGARPRMALILGSGWSKALDVFTMRSQIPYSDIPGLGATSVRGHLGQLIWGECANIETLIFQGRRHWYENEGWDPVLLPVRICKRMGVEIIVLTNAAGGLRSDRAPGSLIVLEDHINAMGANPLVARHKEDGGEFFTDQTAVYDKHLRDIALEAATTAKVNAFPGIYLAVSGPSYETPAEVRMYRAWGADVVGMSTVPEAMLANALGMQVLGLSLISNFAAGLHTTTLSHSEVTDTTSRNMHALGQTLKLIWRVIAMDAQ